MIAVVPVRPALKAADLRQAVRGDHGTGRVDQGLLENAFQLTDISRPVVILKRSHCGRIDAHDLFAHLSAIASKEMLDEQPEIALTFSQWGQAELNALEAIEE